MDVPYPQWDKDDAPVIVSRTIADGEVLVITLVGGDPDGDALSMAVSGCPTALQPNLVQNEITYADIPAELINQHYEWLNQKPNTKFFKYEYTITGASIAHGDHIISFQITDGCGGENWVAANIHVDEENSIPFLDGGVI
jgi:hypothetical protein